MKKSLFTLILLAGCFVFANAQQSTPVSAANTTSTPQAKDLKAKPAENATYKASAGTVTDDYISGAASDRKQQRSKSCCSESKSKQCKTSAGTVTDDYVSGAASERKNEHMKSCGDEKKAGKSCCKPGLEKTSEAKKN